MKNNDHISRTQLMTMVWAGLLAPAAELLPSLTLPAAGKGAWLAPLAAAPLASLVASTQRNDILHAVAASLRQGV